MKQDELLKIAKLYVDRFTTPQNVDETVKAFMTRRAIAAGVNDELKVYIDKYDALDMPNIAVRKGEVGETAHALFSYALSKAESGKAIYLQESLKKPPKEVLPSESLVNKQKSAISFVAEEIGLGALVDGEAASKINVTMSQYNQKSLARLVTQKQRKDCLMAIAAKIPKDMMSQITGSYKAIAKEIKKNKTDTPKVAILWYRKPKSDADKGRMIHVYNALMTQGVTTIILMGDKFDTNLKTMRLRDGTSLNQMKDTGQKNANDLIKLTGKKWAPQVIRFQLDSLPKPIQDNLMFQWFAYYGLASKSGAKFMVCPSRSGGCHGTYFLGVPLIYLDEGAAIGSFLQERMATHAVLDNYLTPIPDSSAPLAGLSPPEKLLWEEARPFSEAALVRAMALCETNLSLPVS